MEYENLVRDFTRRTRHNLALIREAKRSGQEAYEVTQLINSMLGLLVLPKEQYMANIPQVTLEQLRKDGWPESVLQGEIGQVTDLRDLIRVLRNSIAHFNIEFTETGGQIDGVCLTNRYNGQVRWQARLSLADLECITERFAALVLKECDSPEGEEAERTGEKAA